MSAIIPTYNRARLVVEAIEVRRRSAKRTRSSSSTTARPTAPRKCSIVRVRVAVLRQANRGRSSARNTGIREATSDAVIFLDSDDLLLPNAIEEFVSVLEEQPDVDVVYGNAKMIDAEGRLIAIYADRMPGAAPAATSWASLRGAAA